MIRGVTIGKFLPPHIGHSYLIKAALSRCEELHIILCDRPEWRIPASLRKQWLEAMHPQVIVHIVPDLIDDYDSTGWARLTIEAIGHVPDVAFTSEDYGESYASAIGCRHESIDQPREHVAISATQIRENPWAHWEYLHPIVRAYFTRRICLVGPESTGKTTLAQALAMHYHTEWVPEYARDYTIAHHKTLDDNGFQDKDYLAIARMQNQLEDKFAAKANKLLFCDTDAFAVSVWYDAHTGLRNAALEALALDRPYTLYILTDIDVPFQEDGVRIGKKFRQAVFERYQKKLRIWDKPYIVVRGSPEQRLAQATQVIDRLIDDEATRLPGLTRNQWLTGKGLF